MTTLTRRAVIAGLAASGIAGRALAQGVELVIKVNLPIDRTKSGTLTLERADGTSLVSDLPALGKSDNKRAKQANNKDRDPTLPYGDTPEGTYAVPSIVDTGPGTNYSQRSYGPGAAIVLQPTGGEALTAAANGRLGLLIHGGDPGANGRLRATHGCIRLSNGDMGRLLNAIQDAGNNVVFNRCEVVRLSVLVGGDADEGAGDDESDPPPGIDDLLNPKPIVIP